MCGISQNFQDDQEIASEPSHEKWKNIFHGMIQENKSLSVTLYIFQHSAFSTLESLMN